MANETKTTHVRFVFQFAPIDKIPHDTLIHMKPLEYLPKRVTIEAMRWELVNREEFEQLFKSFHEIKDHLTKNHGEILITLGDSINDCVTKYYGFSDKKEEDLVIRTRRVRPAGVSINVGKPIEMFENFKLQNKIHVDPHLEGIGYDGLTDEVALALPDTFHAHVDELFFQSCDNPSL